MESRVCETQGMKEQARIPSYKRHRFPPAIIAPAVWRYFRFAVRYRDVEELLAERGVISATRRYASGVGSSARPMRTSSAAVGRSHSMGPPDVGTGGTTGAYARARTAATTFARLADSLRVAA